MNTVYYGGCWSTNVGNAFIDAGAMHVCREYNPIIFSEYDYLMFRNNRNNYFNILRSIRPKCVFFSGMVTCAQFIIDQKEIFEILDEYNIPVVLNGVGGENYSLNEVKCFREFIGKHNFAGFISRDDATYDAYADLFPLSYRGIDVAFFLSESPQFKFVYDIGKKYTVINEDDLGFNGDYKKFIEYDESAKNTETIVTHHQLTNMPEKYIKTPKTMLSELPYQYIYMYGMSNLTISTRVHACIATLCFGGKAVLLYNTPRAALFRRVGCENITTKPCEVNKDLLELRKNEHKMALKTIMDKYV